MKMKGGSMQGTCIFQEPGSVGGATQCWQISWSPCAGATSCLQPPGQLRSVGWERAGPRCEGEQKQEGEKGKKESQEEYGQRDKKRGEPTWEDNHEFLLILSVVILQGGFRLLPNMTANYFNLHFLPQSP